MITFAEAKTSRLRRISGVCSGSDDFAQLLNDATRMLMTRGNWWGTVKRMTGCVYNECIVWPRQVAAVLALDNCGHSIPPKNHWFSFNAVLPEDVRRHSRFGVGCYGNQAIEFIGTTPVFSQPPCGSPRYVRFYPAEPTDLGKTITVFGIDQYNQTVRSLRIDGRIQDGVVLTLAIPYVESTVLFSRIDRVVKDLTDGPINGYQWDGLNLFPLAFYQAGETSPEYLSSKIMVGCDQATTVPAQCRQVTALVKLAFIEVVYDDDLVLIDNLDALAVMMQSIKASDAYDSKTADELSVRAVHELNLELRNRLPIDQTIVHFRPHGNALLERRQIGRML